MTPTEDSFRALARSSPWRWRTLHFTRHSTPAVEAWIRRPGGLRVRESDGRVHPGSVVSPAAAVVFPYPTPELRPDGLVADRPGYPDIDDDVLMWQDYRWIAMLDPAELSIGTEVSEVRDDIHYGRPAWRALVRPVEGYEPRCGCCSLLPCEAVDRDEWGADPEWRPRPAYPSGYRVALDVATGVLVSIEPVDATDEDHHDVLDLEIHDVDIAFDDVFGALRN